MRRKDELMYLEVGIREDRLGKEEAYSILEERISLHKQRAEFIQ